MGDHVHVYRQYETSAGPFLTCNCGHRLEFAPEPDPWWVPPLNTTITTNGTIGMSAAIRCIPFGGPHAR